MNVSALVQRWQQDGFLILRQVFDLDRVARLRTLGDAARDTWHAEATPESEPGDFGPGPQEWILLHLNHPRYHRGSTSSLPLLLDAVADPVILDLASAIMSGREIFMQANYYIEPTAQSRPGIWHRDCQFFDSDEDAQRQLVIDEADPARELHVHIPLAPTAHFRLVPGSYKRWDSDVEFRIRTDDPQSDQMPGCIRVDLEPGDIAFLHVNSIHRGDYPLGDLRRTIAVTFGSQQQPRLANRESMKQWGGYICTYQPWCRQPWYLEGVQPRTRAFFEKSIAVYNDSWTPEFVDPDWDPSRIAYFTPPYGG